MSLFDYNDEYPTCLETYSTLRIASDDVRPEVISKLMGVGPSRSFHKGEAVGKSTRLHKFNAWLYSTRHSITSRDTRRHIDAILEALEGKDETIKKNTMYGLSIQYCELLGRRWAGRAHD